MTEQTLTLKGTEPTVKKGKKSWSPSNLGDVQNKEDGFRYRWARKDEDNLAKKREEGWEFVSAVNNPKTKGIHPDSRPDEPHPITSNIERRDSVLMRLDEETGLARDEFINAKTNRSTQALLSQTKQGLSKEGAPLHGSITMERRGVRTVIKD